MIQENLNNDQSYDSMKNDIQVGGYIKTPVKGLFDTYLVEVLGIKKRIFYGENKILHLPNEKKEEPCIEDYLCYNKKTVLLGLDNEHVKSCMKGDFYFNVIADKISIQSIDFINPFQVRIRKTHVKLRNHIIYPFDKNALSKFCNSCPNCHKEQDGHLFDDTPYLETDIKILNKDNLVDNLCLIYLEAAMPLYLGLNKMIT